jgi:hypothetical protein
LFLTRSIFLFPLSLTHTYHLPRTFTLCLAVSTYEWHGMQAKLLKAERREKSHTTVWCRCCSRTNAVTVVIIIVSLLVIVVTSYSLILVHRRSLVTSLSPV